MSTWNAPPAAGPVVPGLCVANPETVGKTFPGFMDAGASMLGAEH
jgi:hypothetical protein